MVAGVNGGQKCVRMIGISHRGFEVDEAVEDAAGANPFVYGPADGFAFFGVIAGAMIRVRVQPITAMPWAWARTTIWLRAEIRSAAVRPASGVPCKRPMSLMPSRIRRYLAPL